jgi:RND family efflux transporter MFP subunit
MANNTGIKLLAVAALLAGAYFGLSSYLRPTAVVQTAGPGRIARAVSAQIKVRAEKSLELKTEIGGRVLNDLDEGKAVKAGVVVVEIDTAKIELEAQAIDNELKAAKAKFEIQGQLDQLDVNFKKADLALKKRELEGGRIAQLTYNQLEQAVKVLELNQQSSAAEAQKNIRDIELRKQGRALDVAYGKLIAPFDGTLTNLQVTRSALVSSGQTIATLITNSRVIEARISEENMAQGVAEGQHVRVWFTGVQGNFEGTISRILPNQDTQTLRYIAHLDLNVPPEKLEKTGLSGVGTITIDEKQAKVVVPQRALYNNKLYVVSGGRVQIRTPALGYLTETLAEITSGLEAGEEVIVDNQDMFRAGQRVRSELAPKEASVSR